MYFDSMYFSFQASRLLRKKAINLLAGLLNSSVLIVQTCLLKGDRNTTRTIYPLFVSKLSILEIGGNRRTPFRRIFSYILAYLLP
jgi:hypothetical protein